MYRYLVKNEKGSLFAFSVDPFAEGENVEVTHNTRFDGVCTFTGRIAAVLNVEDHPDALELWGEKLKPRTISVRKI